MLTAALLTAAALAVAAAALFLLGDRDLRRGRLRAVRRIRVTRRRFLRPLLGAMERTAARAWTRPGRIAVARQVRSVADRLERASVAAERFAAAEGRLSAAIGKLDGVGPVRTAVPGSSPRGGREASVGQGWLVALALGLASAALAGANGWLLYRYILPEVPALGVLPAGRVDSVPIASFLAALPFLLGLAYFALNAAGKALGLRVLAALVVLLVVLLATLEAGAAVVALENRGMAELTWWGGIAVATLLGGAAALLPPTVAAVAHAAIERLDQWIAARERRAAGRAVVQQDRLAGRLTSTVDSVAASVESLRAEVRALATEPAGRLILHPAAGPTVERTGAVLRRLAMSVDRNADGPWTEPAPASEVAIRVLADLGALAVWLLASGAALSFGAAGLRHGAEVGVTAAMTAGGLAAMATLLLAGLLIRVIFAAPARPAGPTVRAVIMLLVGVATASLSLAIGSLAAGAEGSLFEGRALVAAAWLNVLVLVAALASARLGQGVASVASITTYVLAVSGWLALRLVDAALATVETVLGGRRRVRAPRSATGRAGAPAAGVLGGEPPRR